MLLKSDHLGWALLISLVFTLLLVSFPLRGDMAYWRPPFLLLLVFYWLLVEPYRLGIGFAWLVGLLLDLLFGGILGQHALVLAVCAYLLRVMGGLLQHFSLIHQCILVGLLALLYQLLMTSINLLFYPHTLGWAVLYPAVAAILAWPLLAWPLRRLYTPDK